MRKYLLFPVSLLFFICLFLIYQVPLSHAGAVVGDKCTNNDGDNVCPGVDAETMGACMANVVFCNPGLTCANGRCAPKQGAPPPPEQKCKCITPNVSGEGKNGFVCGDEIPKISTNNVDPAKIVYCGNSSNACIESLGGGTYGVSTENGDQNTKYVDVQCENPKPIANCKCIGQGTNQQNNFECTGDDPDNPGVQLKGTAFCGDEKLKCENKEGALYTGPVSKEEGEIFTKGKSAIGLLISDRVLIKGITCEQPAGTCTCIHDGMPGTRRNGMQCRQIVGGLNQIDKDYCNNAQEACVNDPNWVIKNNVAGEYHTQKAIFAASPLKGVRCEVRPPVPPPAPPCAQPLDNLGKCLAFDSAFGTISTDAGAFITSIFGVLLSVSGGIALLLIMRAGYLLMTSAGNPERIKNGQDQLIAAIVGLLFIIFSFVILQVIGVEILHIPGLT